MCGSSSRGSRPRAALLACLCLLALGGQAGGGASGAAVAAAGAAPPPPPPAAPKKKWKRRRPCNADDAKCLALRDHECDPYYATVEDKCAATGGLQRGGGCWSVCLGAARRRRRPLPPPSAGHAAAGTAAAHPQLRPCAPRRPLPQVHICAVEPGVRGGRAAGALPPTFLLRQRRLPGPGHAGLLCLDGDAGAPRGWGRAGPGGSLASLSGGSARALTLGPGHRRRRRRALPPSAAPCPAPRPPPAVLGDGGRCRGLSGARPGGAARLRGCRWESRAAAVQPGRLAETRARCLRAPHRCTPMLCPCGAPHRLLSSWHTGCA